MLAHLEHLNNFKVCFVKKLLHEWIGIQPWQWCAVLGFTKVTHLCGQPKIYQCQFVLAFFVFGWRRGTSKGKKWAPVSSGQWHSAWKLRVFWLTFPQRPYKDCKFQSSFGSIVRQKLFNPLECYGDIPFSETLYVVDHLILEEERWLYITVEHTVAAGADVVIFVKKYVTKCHNVQTSWKPIILHLLIFGDAGHGPIHVCICAAWRISAKI